jgi:hypothetical protein
MHSFGRYRFHAEALLTISRKFEELSAIDTDNSDLLAECAAGLTAMAEALVLDSQDGAAPSTQIH